MTTGALPQVSVTGGTDGVRARYDDVRRLGQLWSETGEQLARDAWQDKGTAADGDLLASAALAPNTFAQVERAVLAATVAPGGLVHRAVEVTAVALSTTGLVELYESADAAARRATDLVAWGVGRFALPTLAVAAVGVLATHPAAVPVVLAGLRQVPSLATQHPDALQFVVRSSGGLLDAAQLLPFGPVVPALLGIDPFHPDVAAAAGDLGPDLFEDRAGVAVPHPSGPSHPVPSDLADLVSALEQTASPDVDGLFTVQQIVRNGQSVWVVQLPGTDGFTDVDDVRNMGTNLELIAGSHTAYADAVEQALADAGVHPDDPVMLVGHSQGGMQAAALAGDPEFGYHVTHVVTAGSPVAGIPTPPDVQVVSLENTADVVPSLDGHPNPDTTQHTTVTGTVPGGSVAQNHDIGHAYGPIAQAAQSSGSASVGAFLDSATALGYVSPTSGNAETTTTSYVAEYAQRAQ